MSQTGQTGQAASETPEAAGAGEAQKKASLWHHRDFMLLWSGQTVSEFGSAVTPFALPFLAVTSLHATPFQVGVLTALGTAAFLLIALPAGVVVDRVARHRLMMWCDVLRMAVIASVPIVYSVGTLTLAQLYVVALVAGVLTVFFDVAYQSYLPVLLDKSTLLDGNGKIGTSQSAAQMVGPSMAGGLVTLVGAARSVAVDAGSFAVSAVSLFLIRTPEPKPKRDPDAEKKKMRHEIAEGLSFVVKHPILRKVVACTGTSNFFGAFGAALEMIYLVRILHVKPGEAGLLMALGGLGGVAGGLVSGWLARRIGSARIIWVSILGFGWTVLLVPLARPGWGVLLFSFGFFGYAASAVVYNTAQVSYRQAICPPELLGRMNAAVRWIVWGTLPLGGLIGGALGSAIGIRNTLWIGAVGTILAGLWVFFSPLRTMRDVEVHEAYG